MFSVIIFVTSTLISNQTNNNLRCYDILIIIIIKFDIGLIFPPTWVGYLRPLPSIRFFKFIFKTINLSIPVIWENCAEHPLPILILIRSSNLERFGKKSTCVFLLIILQSLPCTEETANTHKSFPIFPWWPLIVVRWMVEPPNIL